MDRAEPGEGVPIPLFVMLLFGSRTSGRVGACRACEDVIEATCLFVVCRVV